MLFTKLTRFARECGQLQIRSLSSLPSNMIFRSAVGSSDPPTESHQPNGTILCFAWMLAKDAHLEKFRHFWTARGYDIITVQTTPKSLLAPNSSGGTNRFGMELVHFLRSQPQSQQGPILFHNFSVGTYVSTVFRHQLNKAIKAEVPGALEVRNRFRGLILDSVTFLEDSPRGTARGVTESPIGQALIKYTMIAYYIAALPITLGSYLPVAALLKGNPQKLPALFLYSTDDPLTDTKRIRKLISHWKALGVDVVEKCWSQSGHVQHFRLHTEEYTNEVTRFLKKLGLPTEV